MSFSGNLQDVSVVDLLQFIRIGGRGQPILPTIPNLRASLY